MKNVFNGVILLLTLVCFSCQDEAEINNATEKTAIAAGDIAIIKSLGFDIEKTVDYGDYYLVENDITLEKRHLSKYLNSQNINDSIPKLRQAYTGSLVNVANIKNITVGFDLSFPTESEWRTATLNALKEWNSIPGSLVKFVYTASSNPNIKIYQDYSDDRRIANADFPSLGTVGAYIKINSKYNNLSTSEKLLTIVHELGHTIGLRHTDWNNRSDGGTEPSAVTIPGTPTIDSGSFMNSTVRPWSGFSYYDVIGVQYLYPAPITASRTVIDINENVTYSIPNYSGPVTWSALSNVTFVSGQGTASGTFRGAGNGYASVKAAITYSGNTFILTNSNSVWVGPPIEKEIPRPMFTMGQATELSVDFEGLDSSSTYKWTRVSGDIYMGGSTGRSIMITPWDNKYFVIRVDVTNASGTGSGLYQFKAGSGGLVGGGLNSQ